MITTSQATSDNQFDDIKTDWQKGLNDNWREVSEVTYYDALGAVPPIDRNRDDFLLGEPYSFGYFYGFSIVRNRYFGKIVTRAEAQREFALLFNHVQRTAEADEISDGDLLAAAEFFDSL